MTRYKIILNPTSGRGNGLRVRPEIEKILTKYGLDFDIEQTGYPEHATELAFKAAGEGYNVVVAAGGDGTANEVLNGLMKDPETLKKLESVGAEPIGSTPQELAAHLNQELDRWGKLIKARNIRLD